MSATVEDIDVTSVPQFLPVGRMKERTIAWLDGAFKHGRATNGKLSFRGPVKKFPFREGRVISRRPSMQATSRSTITRASRR